jgi:hypothetical protein
MSNITVHLPVYTVLKDEIENKPQILNSYRKYEFFIGDEVAIDYLMDKLLEDDIKSNIPTFQKVITFLTKKYDK